MSTNNDIKIKSMYELNELTAEQKQDIEMIKKVESYLKKVAFERASDAGFEDRFGQSGGENVEKWELSEAEQFRELYEEFFPNNDENKVIQSFLRDRYHEYPEVISKLGKEKETLKEDLVKYQYIQEHKHDIVAQFEQNYKIFENMQGKYTDFFDKVKKYELLPVDLKQTNYLIEAMQGKSLYYYNNQVSHVSKELGDLINEKTELSNQLSSKLNELQDKKILFFHTRDTRVEIKNTKEQIQDLENEIKKNKEELNQFKKESKEFIAEGNIADKLQYSEDVNNILYEERLFEISDEKVEERKERFEKALDKRLNENNPDLIRTRINEIDDILRKQNPESQISSEEKVYESLSKNDKQLIKGNKPETGIKGMVERAKQKKENMEINNDHKKVAEKGIER